MLRNRNKYGIIGIDVGAASVKMVQVTDHAGQPAVAAAAHIPVPIHSEDPAQRRFAVQHAIAEGLRANGFQGHRAAIALSNGEFQMKSIRLPNMPPEEKESAVQFEAQDRFNLGGGGQIRFIPAGEVRHGNEIKEELMVFAARDEVVQAKLELLAALHLRPEAIDIAPCAVARSFSRFLRRAEDENSVNVFIDVGFGATAILITRGTDLSFLKIVEMGGRQFNTAVGSALGLSLDEAADLRLRIMREHGGRKQNETSDVTQEIRARAADAVRPMVERIGRDVQLCLRYFAVTFRGQRPDSVTLVGGEAYEPVLAELLGQSVDIPCIIGHPMRGLAGLDPRAARTLQPSWAVACGLALRGTPWVPSRPTGAPSAASARAPAATGAA